MVNLLISTVSGLPDINLHLPNATHIHHFTVYHHIASQVPQSVLDACTLQHISGAAFNTIDCHSDHVLLRLTPRLLGGKGGFGSQLRAAGGRMASRRSREPPNKSACRDLNGRRLGVVKEAKELAEQLEGVPKAEREMLRKKKEKLEKIIASGSTERPVDIDLGTWEQDGEEMRESVRSAVSEALQTNQQALASSSSTITAISIAKPASPPAAGKKRSIALAGWDEDEDEDEEEEDEENDTDQNSDKVASGFESGYFSSGSGPETKSATIEKGKGKAV